MAMRVGTITIVMMIQCVVEPLAQWNGTFNVWTGYLVEAEAEAEAEAASQ